MKSIYLETAAFFKIFVEEEGTANSDRLIELAKAGKIRIIISDWVINESIEFLQKNRKANKITPTETQTILAEIVAMIEGRVEYSHFTFFAITEEVIINSRFILQEIDVSASDALHVYIAHNSGCQYFVAGRDPIAECVFDASVRHDGGLNFQVFDVRNVTDMNKLLEELEK